MANRVKGDWKYIQVESANDVENSVHDEFAQNTYSHNVTFRAPKGLFEIYDDLMIKIDNKICQSYIATIVEQKNSDYAEYTCGELQVVYPFLKLL